VYRWTELVAYRVVDGSYLLSKVGRSQLAHRPECDRVNRWMVTWSTAGEEARVRRVPCPECAPEVGDRMDPHTVLEATRLTALVAQDIPELTDLLLAGRPGQPAHDPRRLSPLVAHMVEQLCVTADGFAAHWSTRTSERSVTVIRDTW